MLQYLVVALYFTFGPGAFSPVSGEVMLSSSISEGDMLCPGETIMFTCETRGSDALTLRWRSDEYDIRISFSAADPVGMTLPEAISNFIANLTKNTVEDGQHVLASNLRITVSAESPAASVSCSDSANISSFDFQLLGMPEMPQNVTANQLVNGTNGCTILIAWLPPANIPKDDVSHYVISVNGTSIISETLTLAAYPVCECASYHVTISAIDRCGREGQRSLVMLDRDAVLLPDSTLQCSAPTPTMSTCPNNNAAIISLSVFLAASIIGAIIFGICCCIACCRD